jgi:SEC-C motif-containing protein
MRSRFSAFAIGDLEYLLSSWHPSTRPRDLTLDPAQRWTRLDIIGTTGGGLLHVDGTVEFVAHYVVGRRPGELRENSRFRRDAGLWRYVDAAG